MSQKYQQLLSQLEQEASRCEQLHDDLQKLSASKDKFFSIIAHDLKNPIVGFLSFVELVGQFDNHEKAYREKVIQLVKESAEKLLTLLENLLTWSRIQQGMLTPIPQPCDLHRIVEYNIALLAPSADHKQIALKNSVMPMMGYADPNMLNTIIRNLLSNAIKFTPTGGTVEIGATHEQDNVMVMISDTGIGIPEEKLATLFHIATKTQRDGTAGEKGTGLGLILCKEFVEKNGGRIWVESEVGKGSIVRFCLPTTYHLRDSHA